MEPRKPSRLTIIVVPETDRHTLSFRLPVGLLVTGVSLLIALTVGLTVGATVLIRNYHDAALAAGERDDLRRKAAGREFHLQTMRQQVAEIQSELVRLQQLDLEVRQLLNQDESSPVKVDAEAPISDAVRGAGGPIGSTESTARIGPTRTEAGATARSGNTILKQRRLSGAMPSRTREAVRQFAEGEEMAELTYLAKLQSEVELRTESLTQVHAALKDYLRYDAHRPRGVPANGYLTDGFGWRRNPFNSRQRDWHDGLDVAVPYGASVYATGAGRVTFAGWKSGGYGYTVIIDHGYGLTTLYAHNSRLTVKVGDEVKRGDVIARAGSTGNSTGPHVHYEVRLWGRTVDPKTYLK